MLVQIREQFENSLAKALPEFKRFSARVTKINLTDLPCINLYFHQDCLIKNQNFFEDREVHFEIEACFPAKTDAESELMAVRQRIEAEIENNSYFDTALDDWKLEEVDFGHEMVGESRIAALSMTYKVEYQKPRRLPPEFKPGAVVIINGETPQ